MPRYLIERTFPQGLEIPISLEGSLATLDVVANNTQEGATWIHSYVTVDKLRTYCVYDAPSPEAIRAAARRNGLPVDRIIEIRVLDPYFHL